MNVTINNERYNKHTVHQLFKQGRDTALSRSPAKEHGLISKVLNATEVFTHALGGLPELIDFVEER